ncbi:MAG: transcriptional regulator [Oceanospirillaceae bacterium]|nr:transcriptional regulator [Oceanospirillaceae bacterium]
MSKHISDESVLLGEIGARVRAVRLSENLSQEQLAAAASVSRSTIKRLESGHGSVSLANLLAILAVLNLSESLVAALPEPEELSLQRQRASRRRTLD